MMDKERLEAARINIDWDRNKIPPELLPHIDYLLEQAEQLHGRKGHYGYKEMYGICNSDYAELKSANSKLKNQNKRYREAMENALYKSSHRIGDSVMIDIYGILSEALEKEE